MILELYNLSYLTIEEKNNFCWIELTGKDRRLPKKYWVLKVWWPAVHPGTKPIPTKVKDMDKELIDIKMDKKFFSVVSLSDKSDDKDYWLHRNPIERMQHIEVLRRINYGHSATSRLQRILEFTEG